MPGKSARATGTPSVAEARSQKSSEHWIQPPVQSYGGVAFGVTGVLSQRGHRRLKKYSTADSHLIGLTRLRSPSRSASRIGKKRQQPLRLRDTGL